MDEGVKAYQIGAANSLASAVVVLDGKLDQAKALHQKHPMQKHRDAIFQRGQFTTVTELYFAVSDVFLASLDSKPDQRWRPLFEKELSWKMGSLLLEHFNSYRNFSLGLLHIGSGEQETGERLLRAAAKQRIDNFEEVMRANFEGFQLPSAVDRILVAAGLTMATKSGGPDDFNLMLRGGEFLGRTLRDTLGDVAVLLGSQVDDNSRKDAHSYIHLVRQKREWEIDKIRRFIAKDPELLKNKGALMNQYAEAVGKLAALKARLNAGGRLDLAKTLPSFASIQRNLSEKEAFVVYFSKIDGLGKLCIRRNSAVFATSPYEEAVTLRHIRILQLATTADHAIDAQLDKQFPVSSAIYLRDYLFGGLETCAVPGTHIIVSLPPVFAGVPLGALLMESPPPDGEGFDLRKAQWLIKQMSFSVVSSARQYLAALPLGRRTVAPRPFLGIGDPELASAKVASSASSAVFRGSLNTPNGLSDFIELPDTAAELKAVAQMFAASDSDVLLKARATEESFRLRPLAQYDVIHFATHGLIREELPGLTESALLLTPRASGDPFDDGLLSASELSRLTFGARLVVLSACNTAKYDLTQAGVGIQDFQTAFMIAGAPTLLAALWSIDSRTARDIVTEFFRQWRSTTAPNAAEALASATRFYLAGADAPHQHPRLWAAFQIAGYGHVAGAAGGGATPYAEFAPLPGHSSGGEIVGASAIDNDLVISLIADWNGTKMASIVRRLDADGSQKWSAKSYEIGASHLLAVRGVTYALGYTSEMKSFPLVRSFDPNGTLRWMRRFDDLEGYTFADIAETQGDLFVIAYPQMTPGDASPTFLLQPDDKGSEKRRIRVATGDRGFSTGNPGYIRIWHGRIAIVLNFGAKTGMDQQKRNAFGLPSFCFGGAIARVYEFDVRNLRLLRSQAVASFKVGAMVDAGPVLYIGGEATDGCAMRGRAAIYKLQTSGELKPFWTDDTLFTSNVVGLTVRHSEVLALVRHERALGIDVRRASSDGYDKRWGDESSATTESSLISLDHSGRTVNRTNYSSGLSVFGHGVEIIGERPILYGSVGGIPAMTLR